MSWFKRIKEGITTSTKEKKETPEGLWYKCPSCKSIVASSDHEESKYVCPNCGFHERIGSEEYFAILFDNNQFKEFNENITSAIHWILWTPKNIKTDFVIRCLKHI